MGAAATVHSNRSAATDLSMTTPVMQLITREDLKEKLDLGDDFKLVMALGAQLSITPAVPLHHARGRSQILT